MYFGIYHINDCLPHSYKTFSENVEGHFLNYDLLISKNLANGESFKMTKLFSLLLKIRLFII